MYEYAEGETEDVVITGYVQRADVLVNIPTVVTYTLHAEFLRPVHNKELAECSSRA